MRKLIATTILISALALTACGSPINRGTISEKTIEAAYTWIQYVCSAYNAKGFCIVNTPIIHSVPEKYRFDIYLEDETGYVYVEKDTFDEYDVGDYYESVIG